MVRQRNRRIHSGNGFVGSFDAPWSEWSWINLWIKKHKIRFRILPDLRIQSWIFLKKRTLFQFTLKGTKDAKKLTADRLRLFNPCDPKKNTENISSPEGPVLNTTLISHWRPLKLFVNNTFVTFSTELNVDVAGKTSMTVNFQDLVYAIRNPAN